ncbi:hypothetical protein C7405_10642 [Paraburkholderia caballeronis]|uniref:DUF7687 domain-containing protein n=1 Tax=Paraburkholderia caballeronis TaxID=416943 RepID=UPI0010D62281|nr:hypothetical protein [Paraburkholderia caballeronis]TDV35013.1 hypothetical protein C7405_10642 [Paraburkholderia caballeronis]
MRANKAFIGLDKGFWAHVRSISEAQGYTVRGAGAIKTLTAAGIVAAFRKLGLSSEHLVVKGQLTDLGKHLCEYFEYRADVLNNFVQPRLMDAARAEKVYNEMKAKLKPKLSVTMNKQKGDKAKIAYLTALVNMIIESAAGIEGFNPDPRQLTTFTKDKMPLRTLSRRVDGALPGVVNPVAIWEIKEYYYTTTFGSRVADGVYETLLDGMELQEMREHEGRNVEHMLALDAHYTWWECGRSYLCRIIDMLNMGYVDEVLFGYEVVERLPALAAEWVALANKEAGKEPQIKGDVEAEGVQATLL